MSKGTVYARPPRTELKEQLERDVAAYNGRVYHAANGESAGFEQTLVNQGGAKDKWYYEKKRK